jgi:hypothetical protein
MPAAKMSKPTIMTPCSPMLCYSLESKLCLYSSVWISEHIHVKIILLIMASEIQRGIARGREKKDKEEEVSSPDSVMQVLCFLEMGADSDTMMFIVFQSQGQNLREDRLGRTY